jgi:hypothetical protein
MRFRKRSSQPESSVEEQVEPLNEAEQEWVATNVAQATRLLDGELKNSEGPIDARKRERWFKLLGRLRLADLGKLRQE